MARQQSSSGHLDHHKDICVFIMYKSVTLQRQVGERISKLCLGQTAFERFYYFRAEELLEMDCVGTDCFK